MMCHKFESMNGYMNDASDIIARRTLKLGKENDCNQFDHFICG